MRRKQGVKSEGTEVVRSIMAVYKKRNSADSGQIFPDD
jgi:hypothetical protein